jgi:hypothetical protein
MKTILKISFLFLLVVASCKKIDDQPFTLKYYGDAYEDIGYSVTITSDGYVLAGQLTDITRSGNSISSSTKNMGVIKTGWNGNVIWKASVGGKRNDWGSKIFQNTDGSLVCVGTYTDSTTVVQTDVFIAKFSSEGDVLWQKNYGGSGNQTGQDLVKTTSGYLLLCTTDLANMNADSTGNKAGNTDIMFMSISETGVLLDTSQPWGFLGDDEGVAIKPTNDGNYMVLGTTDRSEPYQGQGKDNLILLKVNSSGQVLQPRIIGGMDDEYAGDLMVLSDGYLIAYTVGADGEDQQIYVKKMKTDIYTDPYFTNKITITNPGSTDNSAKVYAISKYGTDSFILSGNSGKSASAKMLIFEIDASGNLVEGHQMIKGSTGIQVAYDVASGDDGYIIAVGKNSYDVNSMMTFLKFKF